MVQEDKSQPKSKSKSKGKLDKLLIARMEAGRLLAERDFAREALVTAMRELEDRRRQIIRLEKELARLTAAETHVEVPATEPNQHGALG